MLQDVEAGRPTELEALLGIVEGVSLDVEVLQRGLHEFHAGGTIVDNRNGDGPNARHVCHCTLALSLLGT